MPAYDGTPPWAYAAVDTYWTHGGVSLSDRLSRDLRHRMAAAVHAAIVAVPLESPEKLQIREGGLYLSARGEKIGPMYRIPGDAAQVWYASGRRGDWSESGQALHDDPPGNLVAELEEPAVTPPTQDLSQLESIQKWVLQLDEYYAQSEWDKEDGRSPDTESLPDFAVFVGENAPTLGDIRGAARAIRALLPEPPPAPEPRGEEAHSRDFQLMLARIIHRHRRGRDLSETLRGAEDLLRRRGGLSVLREPNDRRDT